MFAWLAEFVPVFWLIELDLLSLKGRAVPSSRFWIVNRFSMPLGRCYSFHGAAAAAAMSFQSCPTLCDPIDDSPPGSTIPGILQARTLEWVAISFSNAWKWKLKVKSLSRVRLFVTPWTAAYQAPSSMGFSRQEDWSGLPLLSPFMVLGESISADASKWCSQDNCGAASPLLVPGIIAGASVFLSHPELLAQTC